MADLKSYVRMLCNDEWVRDEARRILAAYKAQLGEPNKRFASNEPPVPLKRSA
jgi:hypothetical protein